MEIRVVPIDITFGTGYPRAVRRWWVDVYLNGRRTLRSERLYKKRAYAVRLAAKLTSSLNVAPTSANTEIAQAVRALTRHGYTYQKL